MSDILGRLTSLAEAGPEMMLEALSMVIDMIGQATDFSGEELERLGTLERRLADIVAGKKGSSG
jgi:hypothetical protein